ncbi:stabilin-2-like [Lineus longissimus]|uniref:stabilin-2-like n=1 Tax=Lineus longissimus TaxID=88925 RepID=UPI002B4D5D2E
MELRIFLGCSACVVFLILSFMTGFNCDSPIPLEKYCNKSVSSKFYTTCKPCPANQNTNCPYGTTKLTTGVGLSGCSYLLILMGHKMMLKGCRHQCVRHSQLRVCCPGFWGFACQECPGSAQFPCSGRGICSDGSYGNGTCSCEGRYGGFGCETCAKHYQFGVNCTGECRCLHGICSRGLQGDGTCFCDAGFKGRYCDVEIPSCDSIACDEHAECVEESPVIGAKCVCHLGYQGDGKTCDAIDPCTSDPCHTDAICNMTAPGNHSCSCKLGYAGDGLICQAVDPCQTGYGGCEVLSSTCVYDGPGQSHCQCNGGYENYVEPMGCSLIDVCLQNTSLCHAGANCTTTAPGVFECKCKEGYIGDGFVCYGNLLQRLIELNALDPELSGKLGIFIRLIQTTLFEALSQHGPFTLFATTDGGFSGLKVLDEMKNDQDRAKQVLKQHLVIGDFRLEELSNVSHFYTLLGVPAEIKYKDREIDIFKYRLQGAPAKGTVLRANILASNGLIHVTDRVIGRLPEIKGDRQASIFQQMKTDGRYNRFEQLLLSAGLEDELSSGGPYVVLAPNNGAWDALPEGTVDHLLSEEGQGMLISILLNHIVRDTTILSEDLVNIQRFKTYGNNFVNVTITELGQIRFDNKANITQSDIPANNGYYHHIDGILIPASIGTILPHRCDEKQYQLVRGGCGPCHRVNPCTAPDDIPLNKTTAGCRYWVNLRFRYVAFRGCARLCNRTITTKKCCSGFYSNECLPCPGGFINACNNHGTCDDGYLGNGTCKCEPGFYGRNCEHCTDPTKFGPDCKQTCTCIKGRCDLGTKGNGRCKAGSCETGYKGPNCEQQRISCGQASLRYNCHAHATCERRYMDARQRAIHYLSFLTLKNLARLSSMPVVCQCDTGYTGDGIKCIELNPCEEANRGGCDEQAKCLHTGPGLSKCLCTEGWVGDGTYCYPSTPCKVHNQCDPNAECIDTAPGKFICRCKVNFHGNGTYCVWDDMCTVKNGGCDANALCINTGPGKNNCTCKEEYYGDGVICLRTILGEINTRSRIAEAKKLIQGLPLSDHYLNDRQGNYTVFIPISEVLIKFKARANNRYWMQPENILKLLSYHVLRGGYTMEQLYLHNFLNDDVDTLLSGHPLNVTKKGNNTSVDDALVLDANIAAINGYIHIIDAVLEPYPIPFDEQNPYLVDLLTEKNLTVFRDYLVNTGFINQIDNLEEDFTLFVPDNEAFANQQLNMSMRYLSSYAIGELLTSQMFSNNKRSETLLGGKFKITWKKTLKQLAVNDADVKQQDLMVDGGVVHVIGGLFEPTLNQCDKRNLIKEKGICEPCAGTQATCPKGSWTPVRLIHFADCTYNITARGVTKIKHGCYSLCYRFEEASDCCPSFYGQDCRVCPGGIDYPCNGHGKCADRISGTGLCTCDENYTGEACDVCIKGKRGPNCNETISCKNNNGYCDSNAICSGSDMDVACQCQDGFYGDGKNCTHWCEVNNGGCLSYASCQWNTKMDSVDCHCPDNMFGDGKAWCKLYINGCKTENGGCHPDAMCSFTPPTEQDKPDGIVTCECRKGFVGDGFQCNSDIYTTINSLQTTQVFSEMLNKSSKLAPGILDLLNKLQNDTQDYTIFVPVNYVATSYTRNDIANMIVPQRISLSQSMNETVFVNIAGKPLAVGVRSVNDTETFYVNDVTISEMNIPATNGIIHFTDKPLLFPITDNKIPDSHGVTFSEDAKFLLKVVVAAVVGVAVVAIIVALVAARMRRKRVKPGEDTKNLIATFSKDGNEDLGFSQLDNDMSDDETKNKTKRKKRGSCEISHGHSFDNPLYETGAESNVSSFPF